MAGRPKRADQLARLRTLRDEPSELRQYARELLDRAADADVLVAALDALNAQDQPDPNLREPLRAALDRFAANASRLDPSTTGRAALFRALRLVILPEDIPVLERALLTYEFRSTFEVASVLRAAALLALGEVDERLAAGHACRLLLDEHTSPMSGEPALTAANFLVTVDQIMPLYTLVANGIRVTKVPAEVIAECLRLLTTLPHSLVHGLVTKFIETEDPVIAVGLFDLLLSETLRGEYLPTALTYIEDAELHDVVRFIAFTLVASRDDDAIAGLKRLERTAPGESRREMIREALSLVRDERDRG